MAKRLTDDELLRDGEKQILNWYAWWGDNITEGQDDRKFLFESQWSDRELQENRYLGKAQLQFNKLYDFYRKAIAEQRKNTVSLELRATENATELDQDTIDLHEGLLRSIAYNSKTELDYQTAFATQLHTSFGAIRVKTDWANELSFNQKIEIEAFENPERCFWDPNARTATKGDGDFCGCYTSYSKEYFKKLWPDAEPEGMSPPGNISTSFSWGGKEQVTVVEYYYKEYFNITILQLANGETLTQSEYNKAEKRLEELRMAGMDELTYQKFQNDMEVLERRQSKDYRIKWCIRTRNEILDKGDWPTKDLPIVYVDGDSYWDGELQRTQSFIRHAKDAQRFLNYCAIEIATALKNSRKETYLVTPQNIKGFEKIWKNTEKQQGALPFNYDPQSGPPIKVPPTELSQSLLLQYQRAEMDLQSIMGVYEAAVGAESNEKSGIAIANRAKQSQNSMFIFFDNLNRAVEQVGRIVVNLMPYIYDTERETNITDANGNTRPVVVNKYNPMTEQFENMLEDYNWDLEVEVGASFEVQKQEAVNTLVSLTQVSPETFPYVADLIAENLDLVNTPQLVERFKNFVPPEILAKEAGEPPPPPPPPSPQEQMMQAEIEIQQEKAQVEHEKNQTQLVKNQVDMVKALAELYQIPQEIEVAQIRADAEMQKSERELQGDLLKAYGDAVKLATTVQKATGAQTRENMNT